MNSTFEGVHLSLSRKYTFLACNISLIEGRLLHSNGAYPSTSHRLELLRESGPIPTNQAILRCPNRQNTRFTRARQNLLSDGDDVLVLRHAGRLWHSGRAVLRQSGVHQPLSAPVMFKFFFSVLSLRCRV